MDNTQVEHPGTIGHVGAERAQRLFSGSVLPPTSGFLVPSSRFKVAASKNLQLKGFSSLNFLNHATQQAVFCPATGDNADISHFFFFFIVCLNFKTAKLSSMDVSVSLVCKSSSRISAIISPLFRIRAF